MQSSIDAYRRFLAGDDDAIEPIVREYNRPLIGYLTRILRNESDAEDLAADTFLTLFLKKPRFREESSFKTFLFRIAHHKAVDYLRKKSRREEDLTEEDETLPDPREEPGAEMLLSERREAVRKAIRSLHGDYGALLYLEYFEELPDDAICRVMGKSKKQLGNLRYRAKAALREALRREGIDDAE